MSSFSDAPDGDSGKGAKIFKTKCAQCHVVRSHSIARKDVQKEVARSRAERLFSVEESTKSANETSIVRQASALTV